jgi:hypothetical protein
MTDQIAYQISADDLVRSTGGGRGDEGHEVALLLRGLLHQTRAIDCLRVGAVLDVEEVVCAGPGLRLQGEAWPCTDTYRDRERQRDRETKRQRHRKNNAAVKV